MNTRNQEDAVADGATMGDVRNPYGGGPGTGISLPSYFRPTASLNNNNVYFPGTEELGKDEMRISFVGSTPFPPRRDQAGTCIMVELGNGKRFFFDFGSGCMRNIVALQVPSGLINDIFLTHLHVDHYADLPYMLPFTATMGLRFKPLRVTGPSGRTPELGTAAMIENMRKMLRWHLEEFDTCPVGDGFEVEVNEFDYRKENEICYDQDGVTVRHWPRSHGKDGASAYRLDWNGLSFVWTGDGRPDELTVTYAKGVDVFVTEVQSDLGALMSLKMGMPVELYNYVIDTHHTPHYAAGYLMKQIQPRIGMATHIAYEPELNAELVAGIRAHWDGLFVIGAPDVKVVNVTKDAIWVRDAALVGLANPTKPSPADMLDIAVDTGRGLGEMALPKIKLSREAQQDAYIRTKEIDPAKYTPISVRRPLVTEMPSTLAMVKGMVKAKLANRKTKAKEQ
jgi:ribonuclease Z